MTIQEINAQYASKTAQEKEQDFMLLTQALIKIAGMYSRGQWIPGGRISL